MSEIKMRVNNNKETVCSNCGKKYNYTKEMYDVMIFGQVKHLCYGCVDMLFRKTLSAQIKYQSRVKSKEDIARINRSKSV